MKFFQFDLYYSGALILMIVCVYTCTFSTFDSGRKPLDTPLSVNTPGSSQFIKQELRNICNARSQNTHQGQGQMMMPQPSPQFMSNQQQQQQQGQQGSLGSHRMSGMSPGMSGMSQTPVLQQQLNAQPQTLQPMDQNDTGSELPLEILEQSRSCSRYY